MLVVKEVIPVWRCPKDEAMREQSVIDCTLDMLA